MTRNWLPVIAITGVLVVSPARAQDVHLPDGPGKETVAALCGACHRLNFLANGYTPEGWHTVMRMMLNFGVPVPKDEVTTVTDYLIKSFPERQRPAAAVISGPAEVAMKQWAVPTPGSRPHDPLAARDGSIWFTGQLAGYICERLTDATIRGNQLWNRTFLDQVATDHIGGRKNYVREINAVLTLDAIERLLFHQPVEKND